MALPFLSPARTVLIIGDEVLSIYNVNFNAAKLADAVPWQADDFEERVVKLIRQDGGGKPVLLVNDMTDQHFKGGQRMPKVSIMDKQSVLDRKLQVAFPNYPIRGALPIKQSRKEIQAAAKENAGKNGQGRGNSGELFLFTGIPMSEQITKTMAIVKRSMASIAGFVLLPVESSDMVASLSSKIAGKERKPSRWSIFVSQHRSGALRQVITRDGQLAMTRMTPITESDQNAAQWAADVMQELKSTISYLSRFGYAADDGTDVMVVASPSAGEALKEIIDIPCNYTTFTVNEAARLLGAGIGLQEEQRYADPLHAAWIGRKARFILPMRAQELSSVVRPRQYATVAMFVLLLGMGYLAWQMLGQVETMMDTSSQLQEQKKALTEASAEQQAQEQRLSMLGFDVKLIKAGIDTYEKLEKTSMEPLGLIKTIGAALGTQLRLSTLTIETVDKDTGSVNPMAYKPPPSGNAAGVDLSKAKDMLATLTLTFPSTIEPGVGVKAVNDLQGRLQAALSGYQVKVTRQVADLVYTESTTGKVGMVGDQDKASQDYIAELQIRGPAHD